MFDFSLSKKTGLVVATLLCIVSLGFYGADYQIYGYQDSMIPALCLITLVFSVIHYTRGPERRSRDPETLGWQVLFLAIAGLYFARDVFALEQKTVQGVFGVLLVLQIANYAASRSRARRTGK